MVFMFNGLSDLSLGGYGEYGIGMRYYINDGTAIRGGVQFAKTSLTREEPDPDAEYNYMMYGVEVVYEKHLEGPCPSISPYFGAGASFAMESAEYTNWLIDDYWQEYRDGETDKGTVFGLFGVLGFEWGFANCMTLGGEYQLGFESCSGETEYDEVETRVETCDEYKDSFMGFSTASVYLSVYF
jgi:hypothetical protein